jgi:ABC-type branched-subunit amino acid transport system substrate-binding protein
VRKGWVKWICGASAIALIALWAGVGSAGAQSTPAPGGSGTNGNASAAKLVKNDPLAGAKGSGLTRGVTSSTIKVGCYLQSASFANADDGFKARFDRANKNKELPGGRKIEFEACQDDGSNPQTNLQIIQKLVQQDQVFAVVGISAVALTPSTDFMGKNQVPYYGWGFLPGFCGQRWGFGFNGCLVTNYPGKKHTVYQANLALGAIQAANLTPKTTKVALQAQDNDAGHNGNATISQLYTLEGAKVVYNETNIPATSAGVSMTPFVQAINAANPNILLSLVDFQTLPALTAAMNASGYKGTNVNYVAYIPGLLGTSAQLAKAVDGSFVSSQIVPSEENTAYIKQVQSDLEASGAKTGKFMTLADAIAYAQADQLVSELKATGKTLNTKTFDQKVNGGKYVYKPSAAGGPGQMSFPSMHAIPADCAAMLKISNATYTEVVPFTCYPSLVKK